MILLHISNKINFEVKNGHQNKKCIININLKEPIVFKMMMPTIRVNSFGGKERKLFF